ncbi:hypothetical protein F5884DRAFT_61533 [Xylogone sp. PMI_703]|nr:hypothetical protein F5884DRAFT_61533 [Xylogone sp. PMI_703]
MIPFETGFISSVKTDQKSYSDNTPKPPGILADQVIPSSGMYRGDSFYLKQELPMINLETFVFYYPTYTKYTTELYLHTDSVLSTNAAHGTGHKVLLAWNGEQDFGVGVYTSDTLTVETLKVRDNGTPARLSSASNSATLKTAFQINLNRGIRPAKRSMQFEDKFYWTGLGGKLPYKSFVAFIRWGHERAVPCWEPERLDDVVEAIIHDIEIANEVKDITTSRTVSKLSNEAPDMAPLLLCLRVALKEIV